MNIKKIKENDVEDVAILHKKYINSGFLSTLGIPFLKLLYKSMINSDNATCLIAVNNGKIDGFISGAAKVKGFYKEFLRKNLLRIFVILLPLFFRPSAIKKIFETLTYPVKNKAGLPETEILSVVVNKKCRGKGVSQKLFEELVKQFRLMNISGLKVVVGSNLKIASRFYEKMGCVLHSETEVHKGEISKVYVWKN